VVDKIDETAVPPLEHAIVVKEIISHADP